MTVNYAMRNKPYRKGERFIEFLNGRVVVFIMRRVLNESGQLGKTNRDAVALRVRRPFNVRNFENVIPNNQSNFRKMDFTSTEDSERFNGLVRDDLGQECI